MNIHQVVNSIAAFSFLSSAFFLSMVNVSRRPEWKRMRRCRVYLVFVFLLVGLSCLKTIIFNLPTSHEVIQTSTLISGSLQALLLCCTGVTFVAPQVINRKFVATILLVIVANAWQMILSLVLWREYYVYSLVFSLLIYLSLLVFYQFKFYYNYRKLIEVTDDVTDEYSRYSYQWIKHFYVLVSMLGLSVCVVIFMPVAIYDLWMLCSAIVYVYVTLCFVNYYYRTSMVVTKVYNKVDEKVIHTPVSSIETNILAADDEFALLEKNLAAWVERKGFVKNELVSEELANQLGVSLAVFRAYFKDRLHTDFRQWRMKQRIEYACEIIKQNPDYPYGVVAEMVGIGDRSNFNKAFMKIKGMSARDYSRF